MVSYKNTNSRKILSLLISLCFCFMSATYGNWLPTAEQIETEAQTSRQIANEFMKLSVDLRLSHEYAGRFFYDSDREELLSLAQKASFDLQKVTQMQKQIKGVIEDYQGDDWELLYGETGLWQKVCADYKQSNWLKCQIDYYAAIASSRKQREQILRDIIRSSKAEGINGELLKTQSVAVFGNYKGDYKIAAQKRADSILRKKNLSDEVYVNASILKLTLADNFDSKDLEKLVSRIGKSKYKDDFELNLRLAFLELKPGFTGEVKPGGLLDKVVKKWPETEDFLGKLILADTSDKADGLSDDFLKSKSALEIELSLRSMQQGGIEKYMNLLTRISRIERFQTPLVFYLLGYAHAESAPDKAIEYYILAAEKQDKKRSDRFDLKATDIAKEAARLGYELYYEDSEQCELASRAMGYYRDLAGDEVNRQIEYLYTNVLKDCEKNDEAIMVLKKIAKGSGEFSKAAILDLIVDRLKDENKDKTLRKELAEQLKFLHDSIDCKNRFDRKIKGQACRLYCQLLLENSDESSARATLDILELTEDMDRIERGYLKAGALKQLGDLAEAARVLTLTVESSDCRAAPIAIELLCDMIKQIDKYQTPTGQASMVIINCKKLARYCLGCYESENKEQLQLIYAEITVLAEPENPESLSEIDLLLNRLKAGGLGNNIDWLRCRGRLLEARGDFAGGVRVWQKICVARKSLGVSDTQSWQWWRSKYYELKCFAKTEGVKQENVEHAIAVLRGSFKDIPEFWAQKLETLRPGR